MTAIVAIEHGNPRMLITVPISAVGIEGSSIYLYEGEILTLEHLLYALLLESANDAAVAIAVAIAGSVECFVDLMNQTAISLGLKNTHFVNPHGLDHDLPPLLQSSKPSLSSFRFLNFPSLCLCSCPQCSCHSFCPFSKCNCPIRQCVLFAAQGHPGEQAPLAQLFALVLIHTKAPYGLAASIHLKSFCSRSPAL